MQIYTVHERQEAGDGPGADAILVKDGFSWPAFAFGPFWCLAHRMWLCFTLTLLAFVIGGLVIYSLPVGPEGGLLLQILGFGAFAAEAGDLRRRWLARRGYRHVSTVAGRSLEECEHRYLASLTLLPRPASAGVLAP